MRQIFKNRKGKRTRIKIGDVIAFDEKTEMMVCFRYYRKDPRNTIGPGEKIQIGQIHFVKLSSGRLSYPLILISIIQLVSAATSLDFEPLQDYAGYSHAFKAVKGVKANYYFA